MRQAGRSPARAGARWRLGSVVLGSVVLVAVLAGPVRAQISLADDIILANQGGESGGLEYPLRPKTGTRAVIGREPRPPVVVPAGEVLLPSAITRPDLPDPVSDPSERLSSAGGGTRQFPGRTEITPSARLSPAVSLPSEAMEPPEAEDAGPPNGLTLDAAIERLVHASPDLRSKAYALPLADADILTAGLRSNPLFFYDSTGVPYGAYSQSRPGEIEHALSIVYPIDYTRKRQARLAVSRQAKRVLEARYQDAVRIAIDNLGTRFVDALEARESARFAEVNLEKLDEMLVEARERAGKGASSVSDYDGLVLERRVAAMLVNTEHGKLRRAKRQLCEMLGFPIASAGTLALNGSLRDTAPPLPPDGQIVSLALCQRPDLVAQRMEIHRALKDVDLAMANRFADAYFLYTPWSYIDNSQMGLKSINTWGAGVFVTIPLYNRNQGNVRRARITVLQARSELVVAERRVEVEVEDAIEEYRATKSGLEEIERELLPAIRRRRDEARQSYESGEIGADRYLSRRRDYNSIVRHYRDTLVRHRRSMLNLNAAVGQRILP